MLPHKTDTYVLGYTSGAIQRLLRQGRLLNQFTHRLLADAGIKQGMRVLDVGCGPGDVSLIAAELVREDGFVLGVDINPTVLQLAQARAQEAGISHAFFQVADIRELPFSQEFDAIVGRLILQHVHNPPAVVRALSNYLRPGGLIAFQDYDLSSQADATLPASQLWERATAWAIEASRQGGAEVRMGIKLPGAFLAAGLPAPELRYEAAIGTGPDWEGYEVIAGVVRDLLPLMQKFGIATAEEIEIETLKQRLRDEIVSREAVVRLPVLVSAWTRIRV